tara:strand:- start:781 stop:993 length:213 start_codon:yes stop_codon:yes gene_type:complete
VANGHRIGQLPAKPGDKQHQDQHTERFVEKIEATVLAFTWTQEDHVMTAGQLLQNQHGHGPMQSLGNATP